MSLIDVWIVAIASRICESRFDCQRQADDVLCSHQSRSVICRKFARDLFVHTFSSIETISELIRFGLIDLSVAGTRTTNITNNCRRSSASIDCCCLTRHTIQRRPPLLPQRQCNSNRSKHPSRHLHVHRIIVCLRRISSVFWQLLRRLLFGSFLNVIVPHSSFKASSAKPSGDITQKARSGTRVCVSCVAQDRTNLRTDDVSNLYHIHESDQYHFVIRRTSSHACEGSLVLAGAARSFVGSLPFGTPNVTAAMTRVCGGKRERGPRGYFCDTRADFGVLYLHCYYLPLCVLCNSSINAVEGSDGRRRGSRVDSHDDACRADDRRSRRHAQQPGMLCSRCVCVCVLSVR